MKRLMGIVAGTLEYGLAGLFVWGGITTLRAETINSDISVLNPLLGQAALYGYAILFTALGLALILAKVFKWRRTHGFALAGTFLTTMYAITLNFLLFGWTWDNGLNIVIALINFALYTRWRYKVIFEQLD